MKTALRLGEFQSMGERQREESLQAAERALVSPPNGEIRELEQEIKAFEKRNGITSDEMRASLAAGTIHETWEVCQWLVALQTRDDLAQARAH